MESFQTQSAPASGDLAPQKEVAYMQTKSPFFRLPFELRQQIYHLHLRFTWDKFIMAEAWSTHFDRFLLDNNHEPYGIAITLPSMMLACKRLYHDLAQIAFGEAAIAMLSLRNQHSFRGKSAVILAKGVHAPLRYSRLRKLVVITNSRHNLEWGNLGWGTSLTCVLEQAAPELRQLVFEMHAMPIKLAQMDQWLDVQAETLLPTLRRLSRLVQVVFRSDAPESYRRAYFPEVLVDFLNENLRATVIAEGLGDKWRAELSYAQPFAFGLSVRGARDRSPQPGIVDPGHMKIVPADPSGALRGSSALKAMCLKCYQKGSSNRSQGCCFDRSSGGYILRGI
jgi:hypothetical protein